jgi:subtilisin-like proprotein convertase family protein
MVGNVGSVLDIEVTLDITHSFMADIEAFLTSPSGRIVELFSGVGAQFNDFDNLTLSDDGAESIATIGQDDLPYTGVWRPEVPLATFFGDESFGLWTLTIRDTTFADEGTLDSWSISVTTGELFAETDENGFYQFENVAPGQYVIREEVKPGWQQTYAPPIVGGVNISVGGGLNTEANFGNEFNGPELLGDFDRSGTVDSSDYLLYRKTFGLAVANPFDGADADGNGSIGLEDLAIWRQNFGQTLGLGGGSSTFTESVSVSSEAPAALSALSLSSVTASVSVASEMSESITLSGSPQAEEASSTSQFPATKSFSFSYNSEAVYNSDSAEDSTNEANAVTSSQVASTDAAFLALIDSAESGGMYTFGDSDDEFDELENGDSELDDSVEGVDALFELIGA